MRGPRRGDVVTFRYPNDQTIKYVKRIIGIGQDVIEIRAGKLIVNGKGTERRLTSELCSSIHDTCSIWLESFGGESYEIALHASPIMAEFGPVTVPKDHYFVMGDYRDNSSDSRFWGTVPSELMIGRAKFIYWSSDESGVRWSRLNRSIR